MFGKPVSQRRFNAGGTVLSVSDDEFEEEGKKVPIKWMPIRFTRAKLGSSDITADIRDHEEGHRFYLQDTRADFYSGKSLYAVRCSKH